MNTQFYIVSFGYAHVSPLIIVVKDEKAAKLRVEEATYKYINAKTVTVDKAFANSDGGFTSYPIYEANKNSVYKDVVKWGKIFI